jgi:hypothetical protein
VTVIGSQQARQIRGRFEAKTRLIIGRRANGSYRVENEVRKAGREGCHATLDGDAWLNCSALKDDGLCKFRVDLDGESVSE